MNVIVVGGGKIGFRIVDELVNEGHDITLIDLNGAIVDEAANMYDCMGVCGNGVDCEILAEARVNACDVFVAVTGSDELNMLSCFLAKKMGAKNTVARIRNPEYNDQSLSFMCRELDLSMSINPEFLTAQELYNLLKIPSAYNVEYFSRRNLEMIEIKLKNDSELIGKKLSRIREREKVNFLIGTVLRKGELHIPDGNFELEAGDIITIVAPPSDMQKLLKSFGMLKKAFKDVIILGGSKIAVYLAKILTASGTNVKIIERNKEKCYELSEMLPKASVINADGSHHDMLMEEGLSDVDAFVSLTGFDEENILTALFASELNVPKVIAKINNDELNRMAEKLGLESIVSVKKITADIILRYTRALENSKGNNNIESLYTLLDGKAEALEFNVGRDANLNGKTLKELKTKHGVLIAGIIRKGKRAIIPTGDDVINEGDKVIVLASASHRLGDLSDILR